MRRENIRRILSGFLAGITLLANAASTLPSYADEEVDKKPPLLETVRDLLDADEIVTANDYEMEFGTVFDPATDFTGLEIPDEKKVSVSFEEALGAEGQPFSSECSGSYKAVYYVRPVNKEHPRYQIGRNLIVLEEEIEVETESEMRDPEEVMTEPVGVEQGAQDEEIDSGGANVFKDDSAEGYSSPKDETLSQEVKEVTDQEIAEEPSETFLDAEENESMELPAKEPERYAVEISSEETENDLTGDSLDRPEENQEEAYFAETEVPITEAGVETPEEEPEELFFDIPMEVPTETTPENLEELSEEILEEGGTASENLEPLSEDNPEEEGTASESLELLSEDNPEEERTETEAQEGQEDTETQDPEAETEQSENIPDVQSGTVPIRNMDELFGTTGNVFEFGLSCRIEVARENDHVTATAFPDDGMVVSYIKAYSVPEVADVLLYTEGDYLNWEELEAEEILEEENGSLTAAFSMPEDSNLVLTAYAKAPARPGGPKKVGQIGASDIDIISGQTPATGYWHMSEAPSSFIGSGAKSGVEYGTYMKTVTVDVEINGKTERRKYYMYCLQSSLSSPGTFSGATNLETSARKEDYESLVKALYLFSSGEIGGENSLWGHTLTDSQGHSINLKDYFSSIGVTNSDTVYAVQHLVLAYLYYYDSPDSNSGWTWNLLTARDDSAGVPLSDYGVEQVKKIADMVRQMDYPDCSLTPTKVAASVQDGRVVSQAMTYNSYVENYLTIDLPSTVTAYNAADNSKIGSGKVNIPGGTTFYLTSETDRGLKEYTANARWMSGGKAYRRQLSGQQDIGFVIITKEEPLSLSVDWPELAEVKIKKKDAASGKAVAGAVYGLYADEAGTKLITQMPATDAAGASSVQIPVTQDTVYLKEISVPVKYVLDTKAHGVKLAAGKATNVDVTDQEQLAKLVIYKEGEMFTGVNITEGGVTFLYEKKRLKGAVYNVYAGEDITAADGTNVYRKGALVAGNVATGQDGMAVVDNLHLGTYTVTEVKAPENYVCTGESKSVALSYAGPGVAKMEGSVSFTNDRQKVKVLAYKQDKETKKPLAGAVFGMYAGEDLKDSAGTVLVKKDTLLSKATTAGSEGSGLFGADLPIGYSYYVKELQAPVNYARNQEEVFPFQFRYSNDKEPYTSFSHTFSDERVSATLHLVKRDKETGERTQGDATFENAVYGLYAREDILHPDGATGVLYRSGEQVATMKTDAEGKAEVTGLYLGSYYLKEITPPAGYLLDTQEHDVACAYEGDLVPVVERTAISEEQVVKQPFQVIKVAENGKTDADLLKAAGFSAYLASSLKQNGDGSYDFTGAKPVALTKDGKTEMFTDSRGYAVSIPLPYGKYIVRETTTPHNYTPVDDFTVTITENHPDEPQVWRVLLDEEFEAKLKIMKKDDESKRAVLWQNTEFKIYDEGQGAYVEQVTTYPRTVTHTSFFTDGEGYLILPNPLKIGTYRIEEVAAPYGYTLGSHAVTVSVDSNTAYQIEQASGDVVITVEYENHPVKGKLSVWKEGEVLTGYDGQQFLYEMRKLKDATFEVYAAEDIYTADFQKDTGGNRLLEYAAGDLVAAITTGEDGLAVAEDLPLGSYTVKEVAAPHGYTLYGNSQEVTFAFAGQDTPVIEQEVTFTNERQRVELTVKKQDAENGAALPGAQFGLYAMEDIYAQGEVIVPADTLLATAASDENGAAAFALDLPVDTAYYAVERKAPDGYVSSKERLEFDASYQGQETPVAKLEAVMENQPTTVEFTKSDLTTSVELDGAVLTVLDKAKEVVDTWTSVKDQPHVVKRLAAGETYTLREETAPYGYLMVEEVNFEVGDTAEIQKVEMKDAVPTALLIINKQGEFLDHVTPFKSAVGFLEHFFAYMFGNLTPVTFEVYAAEDIRAADGVSQNYFSADDLVGVITTDEGGIAMLEDIPVGKYYVKEVETASGYVLDDEVRYVDLSYRDAYTPVVTYSEAWQNARQKAEIRVLKLSKDDQDTQPRVLEGGVFGLFTKEDIKSVSGKVLMEAGTLIEQKATGADGWLQFVADLPVGGSYYVKELKAPDGFVCSGEEQELQFRAKDDGPAVTEFSLTFEDEPTTLEFKKEDFTGKEIPGAHLKVTTGAGDLVEEWVSGEEAHIIRELTAGETYILTETLPADGYVTAESITFQVESTAMVQKHVMKDDVTKVQVSKTDITGSQEIPGARLTVLDADDQVVESWVSGSAPHYIEKLPIGSYTLREERAPKGYVLTEDVKFEVADTGEIQQVAMKNAQAQGKIILNKTDQDTERPLQGVEFEVRDGKGKALETLRTDAAGHAESQLFDIASFKEGKYEEELKYYLVETKPLEGYVADDTEYEIVFPYKDQYTPVIEVKMELTNTPVPEQIPNVPVSQTPDAPKTGDGTDLFLPLLLLLSSAGVLASALCTLILFRKRRKNI